MKLRCTKDSIRIRVRKSDLKQLLEAKEVRESVFFGPSKQLSYALKLDASLNKLTATYTDGQIVLTLPEEQAQNWINSQEVGIEVQTEVSTTKQLHILIEKDFPCLDRAGENKADTYWELTTETPESC